MPSKLSVVPRTPDPAIARLVDDYLTSCRAGGLSPKTINEGYGYPLRGVFLVFCAEQGITEPAQLSKQLVDRMTTQLLDHGGKRGRALSTHTVHSYARAVNGFLKWAAKEGGAPTVKAQLPRLPKKLVQVLDRREIEAMENAADTERDKLIVRVLADTGLRLGELTRLRVRDVESKGRQAHLRVTGKGERDRLVPIPDLSGRLRRFIEHRPKGAVSDRLFLSSRRRDGHDYEPLTTSGVQQLIRTLAQKAEISKPRVYPHLLRHSFATWSLQRGMNPVQLADILGHNSLTMIQQVYAHLSPTDAYQAMVRVLSNRESV